MSGTMSGADLGRVERCWVELWWVDLWWVELSGIGAGIGLIAAMVAHPRLNVQSRNVQIRA